ncbi:HTTM domain-containing protein [Solitalea koreensis]|nr:HTTM domain-containing protein [Solitalea koreensis]
MKQSSSAPLAVFRIAFGLMLCISILRFWLNNWIEELYIKPHIFFSYYGFDWIKPIGTSTYLLFFICGLSALLVAMGWKYRISIITLFLSFTYIELMDKTTYLNHYYFVSLTCLVMIFLPANVCFSADAWKNREILADKVPAWTVDILKLLLATVYIYAGLAKLNSDWLLNAMPLKFWLPTKNDLPVIGPLLSTAWIPYVFSWFGAAYDLTIVFFLSYRKTRLFAYVTVIVFHGLTALLFQIGMFPYVMIVATLIFFSADFHQKLINKIGKMLKLGHSFTAPNKSFNYTPATNRVILTIFSVLIVVQLLVPFRYLLYPGELFWTEEGYRFSWRVMLMEKNGYATFYVHDSASDKKVIVNNYEFLTPLQEKMMSTQTDMILQYAHFLKNHYVALGFKNPKVFADVFVTLNGRKNAQFIDPHVDLATQEDSFKHKNWILPFNDTIKGF